MSTRDILADIAMALGAASASSAPDVEVLYVATARSLHRRATEELRQLGALIDAREAELVRQHMPRDQAHLPLELCAGAMVGRR